MQPYLYPPSFLLGMDVRKLSNDDDVKLVESFMARCVREVDLSETDPADMLGTERQALRFVS